MYSYSGKSLFFNQIKVNGSYGKMSADLKVDVSDSGADFESNLKKGNDFYFITGEVMLRDWLVVRIKGIQEDWPVLFNLYADQMKGFLQVDLSGLLEPDNWYSLEVQSKRIDEFNAVYDFSNWIITLMTGSEVGNF